MVAVVGAVRAGRAVGGEGVVGAVVGSYKIAAALRCAQGGTRSNCLHQCPGGEKELVLPVLTIRVPHCSQCVGCQACTNPHPRASGYKGPPAQHDSRAMKTALKTEVKRHSQRLKIALKTEAQNNSQALTIALKTEAEHYSQAISIFR